MKNAFPSQIFDRVELHSPAKVNLRLKVTGRRPDGYHLLSMLNCLVAFGDQIKIRILPELDYQVATFWDGPGSRPELSGLNDPRTNLAARAAQMFFERFEIALGVELEILKRIPLGGGLGGGSGNAAVVLQYLAQVFKGSYGVTPGAVSELAQKIGSDVPYMMVGGLGIVSGVGERVVQSSSHGLKGEPIWLICPPFGIATPEVFAELRLENESSFAPDVDLVSCERVASLARHELCALIENDLVPKALKIRPEMKTLFNILNSIPGIKVSMSGSGSTLFVLSEPASQEQGGAHLITDLLRSRLESEQVDIMQSLIL